MSIKIQPVPLLKRIEQSDCKAAPHLEIWPDFFGADVLIYKPAKAARKRF